MTKTAMAAPALAGMVAAMIAAPVAAQKLCNMPRSTLLRHFGNIAFGNEHRRTRDLRVIKWVRPIRYRIANEVGVAPLVQNDLHKQMRTLARITGHRIERTGHRHANFTIVFTRIASFAAHIRRQLARREHHLVPRLARADCAGILSRLKSTNEIVRAVVIIPVDHARERGLLFHCIVEETAQLMGLPNDSDDADFSIFNDKSRRDDLGCQDKIYLRLLYHRSVRPGMTKKRALSVARRILKRMK